MHLKNSIQLKAAFLMIVFSLNTLIGFACAIGIDMGFNSSHHHNEEIFKTSLHMHVGNQIDHKASGGHHDEADNDHQKSKEGKDCCNHHVTEFSQLDKTVPHTLTIASASISSSFVSEFYWIANLYSSGVSLNSWCFVRNYHPPIPDIRIAIQSFQI